MADGSTPTRRAVSTLDRTGGGVPQELADYAAGIERMRELDDDDPRSLVYQAAIHGKTGERDSNHPDWDWCQHQSWFFLPWHRMYLVEFERIICSLIGKPAWRLPYWDYTADSSLASSPRWSVPGEFLDPPDPRTNPLYVGGRRRTALAKEEREWETSMRATEFVSPSTTTLANGFGGGEVDTPEQFAGARTGRVEGQPHNTVHGIVGGLMRNPLTAGLDPLFWLHHASIDRLWEVWLNQADRRNPRGSSWLDTEFTFPTAAGGRATSKISAVLDVASLGYTYDDMAPPVPPFRRPLRSDPVAHPLREVAMAPAPEPELIGATDGPVPLDPGTTLAVGLESPRVWGLTRTIEEGAGELAESERDVETAATEMALEGEVFLQLENVKGVEPAVGVYGIYINVPPGEDPDDHPELRAGLFSTFGLEAASARGHGVTQAFDITDVARLLYNERRWDPQSVQVTLTPHAPVEEGEASANDVTVDRIAVYVVPPG